MEVDGSLRSFRGEIRRFVVYAQHSLSPGIVISGIAVRRIIPRFSKRKSVRTKNFELEFLGGYILRFSCPGHNEFVTKQRRRDHGTVGTEKLRIHQPPRPKRKE